MWQALWDALHDKGLTVMAVALDEAEAARPWIEQAAPRYPTPIDREHRVAELYGIVNVAQAAWIDEAGRIVRPPETAGRFEAFRYRDPATGAVPADAASRQDTAHRVYLDAIRDWAEKGADSCFVMTPQEARAHLERPTPEVARAHAHFRLGMHLRSIGRTVEAERQMAEASRLHPESWAIWRQAAPKTEDGFAADESFWERVRALGDRPYYRPTPMAGMPS